MERQGASSDCEWASVSAVMVVVMPSASVLELVVILLVVSVVLVGDPVPVVSVASVVGVVRSPSSKNRQPAVPTIHGTLAGRRRLKASNHCLLPAVQSTAGPTSGDCSTTLPNLPLLK